MMPVRIDMHKLSMIRAPLPQSPPTSCSVGFRLTTLPHIDGKITQELQEYMGEQTLKGERDG